MLHHKIAVRDDRGNVVKWHGSSIDIEDRKRAEIALQLATRDLQDSKAKLEEAQHLTHVGYWEWDMLTDRVNWSDETYRIYGLRPQECPMDLATVEKKIHPEDWKRAVERALSGSRFSVECRLFRADGGNAHRRLWRHKEGYVRRALPDFRHGPGHYRSQSALRRRFSKASFILPKGSALPTWEAGRSTHLDSSIRTKLFRIYGLDPSGKPPTVEQYLALVHPDDRAFMKHGITDNVGRPPRLRVTQKELCGQMGRFVSVRCVGVPLSQGGACQGFLGTAMDVTEQGIDWELQRREAYLAEPEPPAQKISVGGRTAVRLSGRMKPIASLNMIPQSS